MEVLEGIFKVSGILPGASRPFAGWARSHRGSLSQEPAPIKTCQVEAESVFAGGEVGVVADPEADAALAAAGGQFGERVALRPLPQVEALAVGVEPVDAGEYVLVTEPFRGNHQLPGQFEGGDHRLVGGGELAAGKLLQRHPLHRLALAAVGFAGVSGYFAEMQCHAQVRVAVPHDHEGLGARALHAQFFVELAGQGPLQRLALLYFTAGKLPKAALVFMFGAAAKAEAILPITDDGGNHNNFRKRLGHRLGVGLCLVGACLASERSAKPAGGFQRLFGGSSWGSRILPGASRPFAGGARSHKARSHKARSHKDPPPQVQVRYSALILT